MPLIAKDATAVRPASSIPLGYALYGVAHARFHELLAAGWRVQGWTTRACCMPYPGYYPSLSLRNWLMIDQFRALVSQYPGRDWLLPNEPNVGSQAVMKPEDYAGPVKEWATTIRASGGRILGPNIAIQPPEEQAVWYPWQQWLDAYIALPNVVIPDVWAIHNYSATAADWQKQYEAFQAWNTAKGGNRPVVYSETGHTTEVWQHICKLQDERIEALLWFTNTPEAWIAP